MTSVSFHIIHPEPGTETDNYIYTNKTFKIVGMSRLCTYLSWPHSQQSPDLLRYATAETKEGMNSQVLCLGMRPCTSPSLGMRPCTAPSLGMRPCTSPSLGMRPCTISQSGNGTMHHRLMSTSVPGRLLSNTVATNCCLLGSSRKREHLQINNIHRLRPSTVCAICQAPALFPGSVHTGAWE